jgi:hypothetical protein
MADLGGTVARLRRLWLDIVERALRATGRESPPYGQLALRLERDLAAADGARCVLVVGTDADDVAVEATNGIAWSLAQDLGHRVVLVDAWLDGGGDRPSEDGEGLRDLVSGDAFDAATLPACVRPTRHANIVRIGCGRDTGNGPVRVESLRRFISAAAGLGDFVLLCGSNVLGGRRTLALVGLVDVVLLVALEDATRVEDVEQAHQVLADCGARQVGLVLASRQHGPARPIQVR